MAVIELSKMLEIRAHQQFGTQSVLNVYHVKRNGSSVTASQVAEAYEDRVTALLLPLQDPLITHTLIEVQNLGDPMDFATRVPSPNIGTRVGESTTSFMAMAIQFNRTRTDMKNGQKRFAAGVEADVNHNFWLAAFVTSFEVVRDTILATWFTDALPAVPVCDYTVIKRVCTVQPPPSPCPSYRLPITDAELVFYDPVEGIVRTTVRSQVSRKRLA